MISKIVHKLEPITLVGGADLERSVFERAIVHTSCIIAADGGAHHVTEFGAIPDAVIGDMDSLSGELKATLPTSIIHRVAEQDSTDFEKCLMRIDAPLIVGLGFLGGRLDHQLAAFHALIRFADQKCLLLGQDELVFLCPPDIELPLEAGTTVSLFPLAPTRMKASGLKWSFEVLDLEPGKQIGTSNEALGVVRIAVDAPALLCILPARCFEVTLKALVQQRGSWPAHA
jgi:thiamine pyrophosphokinase